MAFYLAAQTTGNGRRGGDPACSLFEKEKVDFDTITIISLDQEVDFKGNPCCSPSRVLEALRTGRGDAGIITESLWRLASAEKADKTGDQKLKLIWTSPAFCQCVFTASDVFVGFILLDAWFANQDRHHENWGALRDDVLRLAPTFDHGASLARFIAEVRTLT